MQEGWHYELHDGMLTRSGVVLNEMKGSFADADELLANALSRALFPDRRTASSPAATRRPFRVLPTKPLPPRISGSIIQPILICCSTAASI